MAEKTTLAIPQGGTLIMPFAVEADPNTDFTGWKVYFIVKSTLETLNSDAIIDEVMNVDPVSGECSFTKTDEVTSVYPLGNYIYGAKVVDADGNVAHTEVEDLVVKAVAYSGATA